MFYPVLFVLFVSACAAPGEKPQVNTSQPPAEPLAKNIILLIGDGMGLSQVSSAFYYGDGNPNFGRFKQIGLINTSSAKHKITDSAAGGTAIAAGKKTYNGAISVDTDTLALKTILEIAAEKNCKTGLIATSSITHATPACFYAHVKYRKMEEEIATQLVSAPVDFFAGGGIKFFANRTDGLNQYAALTKAGYVMDSTALKKPASWDADKKYGYLLAQNGMPGMPAGRGDFLPEATEMALEYLSQDSAGFFMMVEGSQIDWGGHSNDANYVVTETLDFDKAVGKALDFAEKNPHTLVIVTADHETGGFTLAGTPTDKGKADYKKITGTFSTGGHSTTLIPVFAYGPGAQHFQGIYQNSDLFKKMLKAAKWED